VPRLDGLLSIPSWVTLSIGGLLVVLCFLLLALLRPAQTGIWWIAALVGGVAVVVFGWRNGWIPGWAAFSCGALWVVLCLWLLALIDLVATRGKAGEASYTALPLGLARLSWLAPFSIPIGFAFGLFTGHNWW
jgi:hypothetical protein